MEDNIDSKDNIDNTDQQPIISYPKFIIWIAESNFKISGIEFVILAQNSSNQNLGILVCNFPKQKKQKIGKTLGEWTLLTTFSGKKTLEIYNKRQKILGMQYLNQNIEKNIEEKSQILFLVAFFQFLRPICDLIACRKTISCCWHLSTFSFDIRHTLILIINSLDKK
jgi:hypothetical protein